jgi:membrane protein
MAGLLAVVRATSARFREDQGFLMSSALSFAALLCLAPLTLILFSLAGFLMASDRIADYLFDAASLLLPAYGRELGEFFSLLTRTRAVVGLVGIMSWGIFAAQFFSLMRTVLNRVFRAPARRGIVHGFAVDLLMVIAIGSVAIIFTVVLFIVFALHDVARWMMPGAPTLSGGFKRLASLLIMYMIGVGLVYLVFRTLPNTRVPRRAAVVATLAVTVAWEAARWIFTAYVVLFGTYGRLYGSFGAGVAALVWIYYSAVIFVLGGELAAVVAERRTWFTRLAAEDRGGRAGRHPAC